MCVKYGLSPTVRSIGKLTGKQYDVLSLCCLSLELLRFDPITNFRVSVWSVRVVGFSFVKNPGMIPGS